MCSQEHRGFESLSLRHKYEIHNLFFGPIRGLLRWPDWSHLGRSFESTTPLKAPHHWIYGMLALVVGIVLHSKWFGIYLILFGIGHIISDLKDMIELKFYGVDDVEVKKFWGID